MIFPDSFRKIHTALFIFRPFRRGKGQTGPLHTAYSPRLLSFPKTKAARHPAAESHTANAGISQSGILTSR